MNSRKARIDKGLSAVVICTLTPVFVLGSPIGEGRTQRKLKRKKKFPKSFGKSKFLKG